MKQMLILICSLFLMSSCSKDTEDKLMGKWQLREVVFSDGEVQKVDTVWYNFQTSHFMYQIYDGSTNVYRRSYGYNRVEEENRLWLQLISDPRPVKEFLEYTDWTSNPRIFTIDKLTRRELILSGDGKQYMFHKF